MTEQLDIVSHLVTVAPVVAVLIYFIMYFQKTIKQYKEELKEKDAIIQRLNDEKVEGRDEIVGLGKGMVSTIDRLIEKL